MFWMAKCSCVYVHVCMYVRTYVLVYYLNNHLLIRQPQTLYVSHT